MSSKLTLVEFEAWFNDPVIQRLWTISQDVHAGRADAETVEAFEELRDSMMRALRATERALVRHDPEKRPGLLKRWMAEFAAEQEPNGPTRH